MCTRIVATAIAVCALLQNAFQGPNCDGSRKSHTYTSLYSIFYIQTYTYVYTVNYIHTYIHKYVSEGGEKKNIYIYLYYFFFILSNTSEDGCDQIKRVFNKSTRLCVIYLYDDRRSSGRCSSDHRRIVCLRGTRYWCYTQQSLLGCSALHTGRQLDKLCEKIAENLKTAVRPVDGLTRLHEQLSR